MTKKKLLMLLGSICLAVMLALPLVACAAPTPTPTPTKTEGPTQLLIGGSGPGGAYYPMACGIMTIINENLPEFRATAISAGTLANLRQLIAGEMFSCLKDIISLQSAWDGKSEYFDYKPMRELQVIGIGHATWIYWVTLDPEIKTLWDLEGKRVCLGGPGTSDKNRAMATLDGLGFTVDVDYKGILLDGHEAADALMEGRADVMYAGGGMLCDAVLEVDTLKDMYFVNMPEDMWDEVEAAMEAKGQSGPRGTVPANLGLYRSLKEDYKTHHLPSAIWTNKNIDEEIVYKVTKALWENVETLALIHPAGKEYKIEKIKDYVAQGFSMPIHPGALRYYKEVGVL